MTPPATQGRSDGVYPGGMSMDYVPETLTRDELDAIPGPVIVQFGTNWCGYCIAAEKTIADLLPAGGPWRHLKVEDGKGRPLGRSFHVKLWPTMVFLHDGHEVARVVRPWGREPIEEAIIALRAAADGSESSGRRRP